MFFVISFQPLFNQMLKPQAFFEQATIDSIPIFFHSQFTAMSAVIVTGVYLTQLKSVFKLSTIYGQKAAEFFLHKHTKQQTPRYRCICCLVIYQIIKTFPVFMKDLIQ